MSGLCTNLRASALAKQVDSASPGPAAHVPRSYGSTSPTSPRTVIGTALRGPRSPRGGPAPGPADHQDVAHLATISGRHMGESRIASVPSQPFPRAARERPVNALGPGPAYDVHMDAVLSKAPAFGFGTDARRGASPNAAPGPGAYTLAGDAPISGRPSPPRYSMPRSPREAGGGSAASPGPGAYSHERDTALRPTSARVVFGHAQRAGAGAPASPGPAYSPGMGFVLPSPPAFSMSRAPRDGPGGDRGASPGPAAYAVELTTAVSPTAPRQRIGSAARFSAGGAPDAPGPGAYGVSPGARVLGGALGRSRRSDGASSAGAFPGPADYQTASTGLFAAPRPASAPFGRDARFSPRRGGADATPAPGAYSPVDAAYRPASAFARAARAGSASKRSSSPGPGAYSHERDAALRPTSARVVFGHAQRAGAGAPASPGPAYSPGMGFVLPSPPAFSMSRAPRDGPGGDRGASPGPAAYAVELTTAVSPTAPRQRIGTSPRFVASPSGGSGANVGPGAYSVGKERVHITGGALGRSPRPDSATVASPGPADYQGGVTSPHAIVGGALGRDARFARGGSAGATPAPGAYSPADPAARPASAFARAPRTGSPPQGAGADTLYAPSLTLVKPAAPRSPFGLAPRASEGAPQSPGPADYVNVLLPSSAPGWTMRAR